MANQVQHVQYEGYLAADPEMRYTPSGSAVCNFRMGSNHSYKKTGSDEQVKETTWLKVAVWGKLAEIINQYCAKGSWVIVEGRLRPGPNGSPVPYQLKDSQDWAASFEITASSVRILKGKDGAPQGDITQDAVVVGADDGDNIPF